MLTYADVCALSAYFGQNTHDVHNRAAAQIAIKDRETTKERWWCGGVGRGWEGAGHAFGVGVVRGEDECGGRVSYLETNSLAY